MQKQKEAKTFNQGFFYFILDSANRRIYKKNCHYERAQASVVIHLVLKFVDCHADSANLLAMTKKQIDNQKT